MKLVIGILLIAFSISTAMCQNSAAAVATASSSGDGSTAAVAAASAGDGTAIAGAFADVNNAPDGAPDGAPDSGPDSTPDDGGNDGYDGFPDVYPDTNDDDCPGKKIVPCNCDCFTKKDPVCGLNLKDNTVKAYYNFCYMICARDQSVADNKGNIVPTCCPCDKSCVCPYENKPVCATNGKTYGNPCLLCCANKKLAALKKPLLNIDYYGNCISCPCLNQPYFPVCATDGNTYPNGCKIKCADDIRKLKNLGPLKLVKPGPCTTPKCEDKCKNIKCGKPVCGTDGKHYNNKCYLDCANLNRPKWTPPILVLHKGYCKLNC